MGMENDIILAVIKGVGPTMITFEEILVLDAWQRLKDMLCYDIL